MEKNINQTQLDFSCGAGDASINLPTGKLSFYSHDISMGMNNFAVSVSHIYDSGSNSSGSIGNKWKLNLEQSITPNATNGTDYTYTDGSNNVYELAQYDQYIDAGKLVTKYFDKTGSGLTLWIKGTNKYIEDNNGGRYTFNNEGKLTEVVSANSFNVKKIEYEGGKITAVYDNQKPTRIIKLFYSENGLLSKMDCIDGQDLKYNVFYNYDAQNNLIGVSEYANGSERNTVVYKYDNYGKLLYAVHCASGSAFKFVYNAAGELAKISTGIMKVTPIYGEEYESCASDDTYSGQLYCGNIMRKFIGFKPSDNDNDFTVKSFNEFLYTKLSGICSNITVNNERGISLLYGFNSRKLLVSVLEQDSVGKLRTLTKDPYGKIERQGTGNTVINGCREHIVNNGSLALSFEPGKDEYSPKLKEGIEVVDFIMSFWFKHETVTDNDMKIKVSGFTLKDYSAPIDKYATGAWQYIAIPAVDLLQNKATFFTKFNVDAIDNKGNKIPFSICNIRFGAGAPTNLRFKQYVGTTADCDMSEMESVEITMYGSGTKQTLYFKDNNGFASPDCYFTPSDAIQTFKNIKDALIGYGNPGPADFVYCGGRKRIANVKNAIFYGRNLKGSLDKYALIVSYEEHADFCIHTDSPDRRSYTRQHFAWNKDYMEMHTEVAYLDETGSVKGTADTYTYTDTYGRVIKEKDAYNIITKYAYDEDSNVKEITVQNESGGDMMKYVATYADYGEKQTSNNGMTSSHVCMDTPFDITKTVTTGTYANGKTNCTVLYDYDKFKEKIKSITGYKNTSASGTIESQNTLSYDSLGRLQNVSDGKASYGFSYNQYDDITGYTFGGQNVLNKEIAYDYGSDKGSMVKDTYGNSAPNYLAAYADRYGRPTNVEDGSATTYFNYQNIDESPMVAKIETITDGYEGSAYTYSYNNHNEPIKWSVSGNSGKGSKSMDVRQISTGGTKYTLEGKDMFKTQINYHSLKGANTRIESASTYYDKNIGNTVENWPDNANYKSVYRYDSLGRQQFNYLTDRKNLNNSNLTAESEGVVEYAYATLNGLATPLIRTHETKIGHEKKSSLGHGMKSTITNSYDGKGNLTGVNEVGRTYEDWGFWIINDRPFSTDETYGYDDFDRLTYEYNSSVFNGYTILNNKYNYVYENGRLKSKIDANSSSKNREYAYNNRGQVSSVTCPNGGALSLVENLSYEYDNYGNRTREKSEKNVLITKFTTESAYTWKRGNKLTGLTSTTKSLLIDMPFVEPMVSTTEAEYRYNRQGVRFYKNVNGVSTSYYLDGNKIIGEDRSDGKKLRYFYDKEGLCGVKYGDSFYRYIKDAKGNISMICNHDWMVVARYYYDAWGNCKVLKSSGEAEEDTSTIGYINPFRWKTHYYDRESGLYYANDRYYDPNIGQYIDADEIENIFANALLLFGLDRNGLMCDNVLELMPYLAAIFTSLQMSWDQTYKSDDPDDGFGSQWWHWLIGGVVMVAAAVLTAGAAAGVAGLLGATAAGIKAVAISAAVGGLTAGGVNLAGQAITSRGQSLNIGSLVTSTVMGGIAGGISGGISNLSAGITLNMGARFLTHAGMQVGANMLISGGAYAIQSAITGGEMTSYGFGMAMLGGFLSGLTFGVPLVQGIFIGLGLEVASAFEDLFGFWFGNQSNQNILMPAF